MATFLTTLDTSSHIEKVILHSQRRVTLITPYLRLNQHLLERLRDADRAGVEIQLVYGKNELRQEEMDKLREIKRLKLYFLKNLHAKCYANEQHVIISSMNLYEFSEKNNRETSILLSAEDGEAMAAARREIESIIKAAKLEHPSGGVAATLRSIFGGAPSTGPENGRKRRPGTCIRCGDGIRYQPRAPLCDDCYGSWAAWGNEDYPEKKCHGCGTSAAVSKARPLCSDCFRQDPFTNSARF
jgi:phosphatidylserine/phosphatidylglycerophosphate/cardiolipin synthase-like enzyme